MLETSITESPENDQLGVTSTRSPGQTLEISSVTPTGGIQNPIGVLAMTAWLFNATIIGNGTICHVESYLQLILFANWMYPKY